MQTIGCCGVATLCTLAMVGALPTSAHAQNAAELAAQESARLYTPPPAPAFEPNAHLQFALPGHAVVNGQAFLRQQGGGVVTCAGSLVELMPNTPYFRETVVKPKFVYGAARPELPVEAKFLVRETMCDANGNYSFTNVPSGSWLMTTNVSWIISGSPQGGGLLSEVNVRDGDAPVRILMSNVYSWP